ncbi:MAG: hypothetical protein AABX40_05015 [Candidatus Hydrothermarchaeota archaeon]
MGKTVIFLCLMIVAILIVGCINRTPQTSSMGDIIVELKIHDSLPKSLTLHKDGTLIFTEGDKKDQISLSPGEVESLKQIILGNNFFSLNGKYEGSRCCDFVAHTITATIGDNTHTVYCYNACPDGFSNIMQKIKSFWPYKIQYSGFA